MKRKIWTLIELYYEHKLDLLKRDMRVNWATEREIEVADIEKVEEEELEKNLNKLSELKPFIKWLVENDKIKPLRKFIGWETDEDEPYIQFDLVDQYIAYLSIQDEPIRFLCEILK